MLHCIDQGCITYLHRQHDDEDINEVWLSDRDRFSYEGIYSSDRLQKPQVKENGEWRELDWEDALGKLAEVFEQAAGDKVGLLAGERGQANAQQAIAQYQRKTQHPV